MTNKKPKITQTGVIAWKNVLQSCSNRAQSTVLKARQSTCPRAVFLDSACSCLRHEHADTRALTSTIYIKNCFIGIFDISDTDSVFSWVNSQTFLKLSSQPKHFRFGNELASSSDDFVSESAMFTLQYGVAFLSLVVQSITKQSINIGMLRLLSIK